MLGFVLRRLLISIPVVLAASFVTFLLVAWSGDPLAELRANPNYSLEQVQARAVELGLDQPVLVRYWEWITGALRGDLGMSARFRQPVAELLWDRMLVTLNLVVVATLVAVVIGVVIGVVSAVRQYSGFDYAATFFSFVFFAMPVFWLAAVLKDLAIRFNNWAGTQVFFTVGAETPNFRGSGWELWLDRLGHLILPALTLILISVAGWSRYQRATMLETLQSDYVRTARAKGLTRTQVLRGHALRNALIPVVTIVAIDFAVILGGAVLTETVFGWKGMGILLTESLQNKDVYVVQGWLLVTAIIVVLFNLLADILYGVLDPRIRRG